MVKEMWIEMVNKRWWRKNENGEGKIVWDHNNYSPGDEEELYEKLTGL